MNDIFTASGSAKLYGCWTDAVTKFHPGSFYNFEQDNMPLHDLEERDELLWEQLGYPTSSIPGMVLLVSADAPATSVDCNKNIFHDLSSLQKSLPKYINYPLIIEVASFGDLGELTLNDITMGPSGSIEVINRLLYAVPVVTSVECSAISRVTEGPHAQYPLWKDLSSNPGSSFFSFIANLYNASPSSLLLNQVVMRNGGFTGVFQPDPRALDAFKGFYSNRSAGQEVANQEVCRLSVADLHLPPSYANPTLSIHVSADVYEEQTLPEIYLYDPSSFNQSTGAETFRTFNYTLDEAVIYQRLVAYGNYLRKITVKNCNGPLYIRGFYCSGDGLTSEIGVDVNDSTVNFDTLAVDHFVSKGISLKNSTVSFMRDLFVNRCYGLDDSGNRLSKDWATINSKLFDAPSDDSAGIEALNSEIFFDLAEEHTSNLGAGIFNAGLYTRMISRNSTGLRLINSIVRGGKSRPADRVSSPAGMFFMDFLSFEGNANYGIELENSRFRYEGRLEVFGNTRGIRATNSNFNIQEFSIDNNHVYGMFLDSCEFKYNLNGVSATDRFDFDSTTLNPQNRYTKQYSFKFKDNGQHLLLRNSTFRPTRFSGMQDYYGRLMFIEAHGISHSSSEGLLPGIHLDSSLAELINATSFRKGVTDMPANGAHARIANGSELICLGTASSICGFFAGSSAPTYGEMQRYAAISVENGSTARFRGPTVIYDGAVNVYANKNSNVVFEPHKKIGGGLDIDGFSLTDPASHTMVELKAYNSCIVADKNSTVTMEDLGDFHTTWTEADITNTTYDTSTTLNYTPYVSAGFFQFYPNPNEAQDYASLPFSAVLSTRGNECRMTNSSPGRYWFGENPWGADPYALSSVTEGGMCLRALNNSHVRVRNVHFPCGWWNASSVYYDTSAADEFCSRLFIWNIANNSTMHVDHVSVSGVYPLEAGYHGPSAVWVSGAGLPAYGAPSGTPDTSSLSVLDFYGEGSGAGNAWVLPDGSTTIYGQVSFENQGPFRIYTGVDSMANALIHGGGYGILQQIFAQGYNASGNAYSDNSISSIYGKMLRINETTGALELSGFYYSNEFVDSNPNAIILDESGANLFANAKNGAMGTSNRPQICMIYSSKRSSIGEGRSASSGIKGKGFKSSNIFDLLEEN